jgi:hypothetical protein
LRYYQSQLSIKHGEDSMAEKDPITRIKELEAEKSKLIESAKSEAPGRAKQAVSDLNALGFSYQLVDRVSNAKPKKGMVSGKACPICDWKTNPPHDARAHRSQGKRKHAFSSKELTDLGLRKVA